MSAINLLTITIFLPLVGGVILLLLPNENKKSHWVTALATTILTLIVSLCMAAGYHTSPTPPTVPGGGHSYAMFPVDMGQHGTAYGAAWIPQLGIYYHVGLDGLGLLMVLMTTVIFPFVVKCSHKEIQERTKMFYFLILLAETAIIGVFSALNLILFYMFYEAMLIPLYFVVGMWGGANRIRAAIKFFLYTMVGSMLMLAAMLAIYFLAGSFDYEYLATALPAILGHATIWGLAGRTVEMLLFLGFFAAFAVKSPIFPFHSWVPDAYSEAPTGGSVVLVALKMGLFGMIRFCIVLFPRATHDAAPIIITLAVIGVIYSAIIAAVQKDLKRLVAYSSISHVGVIILAIFALNPAAFNGAIIQMVAHTVTTGALFILIGILYARRGSYEIADYGGVAKVMPVFAAFFLLAVLSSIALPGTAGFTGEFYMLLGAFQVYPWAAGIATTAAIWSVVYMLWMFQRVMHGKAEKAEVTAMTDLRKSDLWVLAPLALLIVLIGVFPVPLERVLNGNPGTDITGSVANILNRTFIPDRRDSRSLSYLPAFVDHRGQILSMSAGETTQPSGASQ